MWTESFTADYNFSQRNVSLNVFPPETLLGPGGIGFEIGGNTTQFSLVKEHPEGIRDTMSLRVSYSVAGTSSLDVFALAEDNLFTEFWRLTEGPDSEP